LVVWSWFDGALEPIWLDFGTNLVGFWNRFGLLWRRSGGALETVWLYFGTGLMVLWNQFGWILEPVWLAIHEQPP
jgi:hypothetical protein